MDEIFERVEKGFVYSGGTVNGRTIAATVRREAFKSDDEDNDEDNTTFYEKDFVTNELRKYYANANPQIGQDSFSEVDTIGTANMELRTVFHRHNFRVQTHLKKNLPIDCYKEQILSRIDLCQVTIVEGPTGCGKTTQVPQMILDKCREKDLYCKIAVTQPRKIATINVAKRVCEERGWSLGTICGYQVGLEKAVSLDQVITYMTLGVLLQKLIRSKSLREFTHIIIDEVHERNQELDFLLLIVRKYLFTNSPNTKVVLMSATMNSDEFAFYFRKQVAGQPLPAPIIKVEKEMDYHKSIFYLDQIWRFPKPMPKFDVYKPEITQDLLEVFIFLLEIFDKLDNELEYEEMSKKGSVLVFLPGIGEIEEAHKMLLKKANDPAKKGSKWDVIPLHSSLPNDEQAKVFKPVREGYRKVILATNIAESSITVVDSSYVIDFCQTKVMTVAPQTNYMSLKLEWASHTNCDQRAGRVGRTCDGRVYRLIPKKFYLEDLKRTSLPEILRAPLSRVVLQAKMMDLNETPAQVLALAMQPPSLKNIQNTILELKEIGGLLRTCRGEPSTSDGDVTFLGQVMAVLPLDVHLSKMIVLGQLYSCLDETIIIAAGCSIQNIFSTPFQKRLDSYRKLVVWADSSNSDLIALLNLYTVWQNLKRENSFQNERKEAEWCRKNMVNLKGLREWHLLVGEIRNRLEHIQVKDTTGPNKVILSDIEKPTVLKVIMAGAFYPNYFVKTSQTPDFEREAVKILAGRDPFSTVYFTGMDTKQPCQIYVRQIKELIRQNMDVRVANAYIGFDTSSKIYVEFRNAFQREPVAVNVNGALRLANSAGKIPNVVYELIRQRQLKTDFTLKLLDYNEAWRFAERHGLNEFQCIVALDDVKRTTSNSITDYNPIPPMDTQYLRVHISNHIDAAHFWVQNDDPPTNTLLQQLDRLLNRQVLTPLDRPPIIGEIYVTRFKNDGLFYRSKVLSVTKGFVQIIFIDYGNIQEVRHNELFLLPRAPPCRATGLAYECALMGVQPSYKMNPSGVWCDRINAEFCRLTGGLSLYAEVYAVVNNVVELEVYRSERKDVSINDYLLKNGYAEPCNPSYLSKQNHQMRLQVYNATDPAKEAQKLSSDIVSYSDFADLDIRTRQYTPVTLRGPFSPLESKLFSCTQAGAPKSVDIEGSSVNAVFLDTDPDNRYSRLLVAAHVGEAAISGRLMLRQTTLMPNVPGLPALMALLFCPTMEPKITEDDSVVASVLCGLGYNKQTKKALYPSHDILLKMDTELKIQELEMINRLRYLMNNGLKLMAEMEQGKSTQDELLYTQSKIRQYMFNLINLKRAIIDENQIYPTSTSWGNDEGLELLRPNMENDENDVWQLLWFVKLMEMTQRQREIKTNLAAIENYMCSVTPFEKVKCLLCDVESFFLPDLRFHVISPEHQSKLQDFNDELEKTRDDNSSDSD